MKRPIVFTLLFTILSGLMLQAQAPPSTDIYTLDLKEAKRRVKLSNLQNVTDRDGYDNQPFFTRNNELFYTSYQADGQTDIMLLNLADGSSKNITNTPNTSEYSAQTMSRTKDFSVVRVEEDGKQRLWRFSPDGATAPTVMFEEIAPVGYYAWASTEIAMFVLGDPNKLMLSSTKVRNDREVTKNIGRTIKARGRNLMISKPISNGNQEIYSVAGRTDKLRKITTTPKNANDWAVTPQGSFLVSVGSEIWKINPEFDSSWSKIIDLSDQGVTKITRIAVSPDNLKIAIVVDR